MTRGSIRKAAVGSITHTGLDLYGAESVDILKGPSSVLYGQTPPGGIVNVTSCRPRDEFDGELALAYGNYDHRQVTRTSTASFSFAEDVDVFAIDTRINASATTGAIEHQLLAGIDYRTYDYIGSSAFGFGMPPAWARASADVT